MNIDIENAYQYEENTAYDNSDMIKSDGGHSSDGNERLVVVDGKKDRIWIVYTRLL